MDTWTYGDAVAPPEYRDRRLGWSDTWRKDGPGHEPVRPPGQRTALRHRPELDGAAAGRGQTAGVETPNVMGEYVPKHIPERIRAASTREPLKPLHVTQPEGPSFTLDGNLLQWQNWSLRIGFNYREGMTLHTVRYRDGDRERSVAHRMSFAEMIVPYRDSSEDHYRRTAFDIGEWGLGFMTTSLELGCDCLGEIRYLDAVLHDSKGEPYTITNAICIHEEDDAVLWKHVDHDAGAEVRRMRRLTISFHVTVANYEYLVYWRLYQDGNIECEVRATGIMVTTPLARGQPHPNGTLVDERTYAPFHQHFLVARLDMDVDGSDNTVFMSESLRRADGARQPVRPVAGARATSRCAPRARASRTSTSRPSGRGRSSTPTSSTASAPIPSYKLVPGGAIPPMFDPGITGAQARQRHRPHPVGHAEHRPTSVGPQANSSTSRRRDTGLGRVDQGQPVDREHRRRALVRVRHPPHHPTRGLAGDAGRRGVVLAQAVRVLRPQSRARRAPAPRPTPATRES